MGCDLNDFSNGSLLTLIKSVLRCLFELHDEIKVDLASTVMSFSGSSPPRTCFSKRPPNVLYMHASAFCFTLTHLVTELSLVGMDPYALVGFNSVSNMVRLPHTGSLDGKVVNITILLTAVKSSWLSKCLGAQLGFGIAIPEWKCCNREK